MGTDKRSLSLDQLGHSRVLLECLHILDKALSLHVGRLWKRFTHPHTEVLFFVSDIKKYIYHI